MSHFLCYTEHPVVPRLRIPSAPLLLFNHAAPWPASAMAGRHAAAKAERSREQKQNPPPPLTVGDGRGLLCGTPVTADYPTRPLPASSLADARLVCRRSVRSGSKLANFSVVDASPPNGDITASAAVRLTRVPLLLTCRYGEGRTPNSTARQQSATTKSCSFRWTYSPLA